MTVETAALDELTVTPREVAFPGSEPKTVRLALEAGEEVPAHRHPEREIVVYLVSGRLDVRVDGESNVLEPGDLLRFDGRDEVSPKAEADSTALLVLAPRSDGE
ncbi:cupin domain-containing protein [Halorussus halobius]|uniref:cupin domain-containing protein n=1 Tax=Halorussus halobius TaxID=1710537 RepID=UPI001092D558|nr:cupin domain-containing protein [Halorussus halobius]